MKVAQLLERRRRNWQELESLCVQISLLGKRGMGAADLARFAALYRAACADLALADAYQLPPNTIRYLHQLVARAHNQLYRSRAFKWQQWLHELFVALPRRLFDDGYLRLAFAIFWGPFIACM